MKLIGHCDVDAGLLMIGDPCYHVGRESHDAWLSWLYDNGVLGKNDPTEGVLRHLRGHGHAGAGVWTQTAYGDGTYPVYKLCQGTLVVVSDDDYKLVAKELRELAKFLEEQEKEMFEEDAELEEQ